MKRFLNWQVAFGLTLIFLSALVYFIHYAIFRDAHHIYIYLIGDVAFVFLEVLLVTLVLHRLLAYREKQSLLSKLNMVIGAFYSEVGTDLLKFFADYDPESNKIAKELIIRNDWSQKDFLKMRQRFKVYDCLIDSKKGNLVELKDFLHSKRGFLLNLLENPNVLEHEEFTNLLWAVFHLTEELIHRKNLKGLPETDFNHLAGDIKRVYILLISQWLDYMNHLKTSYPYLFSLALRTNPFDKEASVEIAC
jgi:hypothetical protein